MPGKQNLKAALWLGKSPIAWDIPNTIPAQGVQQISFAETAMNPIYSAITLL